MRSSVGALFVLRSTFASRVGQRQRPQRNVYGRRIGRLVSDTEHRGTQFDPERQFCACVRVSDACAEFDRDGRTSIHGTGAGALRPLQGGQ